MKDFNPAYDCKKHLDEKIKNIPVGTHFGFITDTHWEHHNQKYSTKMMKYMLDNIGAKTVLFGGDFIELAPSRDIALEYAKKYFDEMYEAFGDNYIPVTGDHDINSANIHTRSEEDRAKLPIKHKELIEISYAHLNNAVFMDWDKEIKKVATGEDVEDLKAYLNTNYYVDRDDEKIRYIVLQTGEWNNGVCSKCIDGTYGYAELYLGMPLLYKALKTLPEGYTAVVAGHNFFRFVPMNEFSLEVAKMLYARKHCLKISMQNHTGWDMSPFFPNGEVEFDFTDCKPAKVICLCGNAHRDNIALNYLEDGEMISVEYDEDLAKEKGAVMFVMTQRDTYVICPSKGSSWEMKPDTISEQCFDIVTLTDDNYAVFTRIGAGFDRKVIL